MRRVVPPSTASDSNWSTTSSASSWKLRRPSWRSPLITD